MCGAVSLQAPRTPDPLPIRVMIVDDHPGFRCALERLVRSASDLVLVGAACDGEAAVALAARLSPQVVVMDLGMAGVNGVEATRRVRAQPRPPVIVALSGSRELTKDAVAAGAAVSLLKDVDPDELLAVIRSAAGVPSRA